MRVDKAARPRLLLLALAFGLRLLVGLASDPLAAYRSGGDSGWYLMNGYALATGFESGWLRHAGLPGLNINLSALPTGPVYLLLAGFFQVLFEPAAAVMALRLFQAALGAAACAFVYRMAVQVAGDRRAGLVAAAALAVSPAFVIEAASITTESVYIFLTFGALALVVDALAGQGDAAVSAGPVAGRRLALAGLAFGLAALTRAVILLYPAALALYLLAVVGWRRGWRAVGLLLAVYTLTVSTWTLYNLIRYDRLVIGAEGFAAFLYIGATGWQGPDQVDAALRQAAGGSLPGSTADQQAIYLEAAAQSIGADPVGYLRRRAAQLGGALLQPHGTVAFGGESLKDAALAWLRDDRSPGGLLRLAQGDQFWPKLAIYGFHYGGLLLGLVGLWRVRRRWRLALPLAGFAAYTLLLHLALDAIPRYLFPALLLLWVFAGAALPGRPQKTVTGQENLG